MASPRKGRPRSATEDAAAALVAVKKGDAASTPTPEASPKPKATANVVDKSARPASQVCNFDGCYSYKKYRGGYCQVHREHGTPTPVKKPAGKSAEKKSSALCKADDCPRYRKAFCEGYCIACFKSTFASDTTKIDAVMAKVMCQEEGCPKQNAPKCDGYCLMCYRKHNPGADRCFLPGCDKIQQKKEFTGYCAKHAKFVDQLRPEPHNEKSLKPLLKCGTKVYSAYWPPEDPKRDMDPEWYPATISSYKVSAKPADARYGPVRFYNVKYDDGDSLTNIPDHFVFSADEYLLSMRLADANPGKKAPSWKGVKNVTDKQSKDKWAKHVGWFETTIDGETETFSLLGDALRAYDASVVRAKGLKTREGDLNLPEDWTGLLGDEKKPPSTPASSKKRPAGGSDGTAEEGKAKSGKPCMADGCTKIRHGRCGEYCIEHFKVLEPDPEKVKSTLELIRSKRQCKRDGCERYTATACGGLCRVCFKEKNPDALLPPAKKRAKKACELVGCPKQQQAGSDYCNQHASLESQLSGDASSKATKGTKSLRPHLKNGSLVYAAYWPPEDPKRDTEPEWYPGVVTSHQVSKAIVDDRYGHARFYNVKFDDGDTLKSIPDQFVFPADDYLLYERLEEENPGKKNPAWRGVKNVTDKKSRDMWAKHVGWYCATIGGKEHTFSTLADALRAHDVSVVQKKGVSTKASELNLPEEWTAIVGETKLAESAKRQTSACGLKGCDKFRQLGSAHCTLHASLEGQLSADVSETASKNTKLLRPHLRTGSKVYAAYWPPEDPKRNTDPDWYPGVVSALKLSKTLVDDRYGYARYYDIKYEDGDFLKNVPDHFTMSAEDYALTMRLEEEGRGKKASSWRGVKNVTAKKSKDTWAKNVGWYQTTIDGETHNFSLLADALRAHDASVVRERGVMTKASDLNLPEEWKAVFAKEAKSPKKKTMAKKSPAKEPPKKRGRAARPKPSQQTVVKEAAAAAAKAAVAASFTSPALAIGGIGQKRVLATIVKPSKDAKLGLGLGQRLGGVFISSMKPDSLFAGTGVEVGMVLESVNGQTYRTMNECLSLLTRAEGQLTLVAVKPIVQSPVRPTTVKAMKAADAKLPAAKPAAAQPPPAKTAEPKAAKLPTAAEVVKTAATKPPAAKLGAPASSRWSLKETVLLICLDDKYDGLKAGAKYEKMAEHLNGRDKIQCGAKVRKLQSEAASGKGIKAMLDLDDIKTTLAKWSKEEIDQLMTLEAQLGDEDEDEKNIKLAQSLPRWKDDQCAFKTLFMRWETKVRQQDEAKKQRKRMKEEAATEEGAKKRKLDAMAAAAKGGAKVTPSAQKDDKGLDTDFVAMLNEELSEPQTIEDLVEDGTSGKSEE